MEQARSKFLSNPVLEKLSSSPIGDSFTLPSDKLQVSTRVQQVFGVDQTAVTV